MADPTDDNDIEDTNESNSGQELENDIYAIYGGEAEEEEVAA